MPIVGVDLYHYSQSASASSASFEFSILMVHFVRGAKGATVEPNMEARLRKLYAPYNDLLYRLLSSYGIGGFSRF